MLELQNLVQYLVSFNGLTLFGAVFSKPIRNLASVLCILLRTYQLHC